jgi:hypothetical protein
MIATRITDQEYAKGDIIVDAPDIILAVDNCFPSDEAGKWITIVRLGEPALIKLSVDLDPSTGFQKCFIDVSGVRPIQAGDTTAHGLMPPVPVLVEAGKLLNILMIPHTEGI